MFGVKMDIDERVEQAVRHTEILRVPKQKLSTFGITSIYYYLLTEPIYAGENDLDETVIREGRVIAQKPKIVTPYYLSRLEGFSSDARRYFDRLLKVYGPNSPGLFYAYRNEPKGLNIVSGRLLEVAEKINAEIDQHGDPLASIIKGEDELWDVSLLKFIFEVTRSSLEGNLAELGSRGLLNVDAAGVPADARVRIEELFSRVKRGEVEPGELKRELDRWNLFEEYEDRFFAVFRRK